MKPILLLVDLQQDYLSSAGLEPAAGMVVEKAAQLLSGFRELGLPVAHAWTTVDRRAARDQRMPHWRRLGKWQCVSGTKGHEPPPVLRPRPGEFTAHKRFFSAFGDVRLDPHLRAAGIDTLLLAGVHLHGCVRATALEAYEKGYAIWIADDAVASDDPLHAAITRRYLDGRAAEFGTADDWLRRVRGTPEAGTPAGRGKAGQFPAALVAGISFKGKNPISYIRRRCPWDGGATPAPVPIAGCAEIEACAKAALGAAREWLGRGVDGRAGVVNEWADRLKADQGLATAITAETGKPIRYASEEVEASVKQLRAIAQRALMETDLACTGPASVRYRRIGVVAVITPWNNPVYIPCGKVAAALIHGNTVIWKPAPAGARVAWLVMQHLVAAASPRGAASLVFGDASTATALMSHPSVGAVTLTSSAAAGYSALEVCGRRHIPLQAELGGNNAAIVWPDAELSTAAGRIAEGAMAMAGQRCTANRRVIVEESIHDEFVGLLTAAVRGMPVADPFDARTRVGPLISFESCERVTAVLARARSRGIAEVTPHDDRSRARVVKPAGAYLLPTLALVDDPRDELVQEETFGPVLVVQRARNWNAAMALCNGVKQGLAAALFSRSPAIQKRFLGQAEAGILKINRSTAGAEIDLPFGGWKSSGIGPPEHGASDREFHTRTQAIYQ